MNTFNEWLELLANALDYSENRLKITSLIFDNNLAETLAIYMKFERYVNIFIIFKYWGTVCLYQAQLR